jgi:hypothetical protein
MRQRALDRNLAAVTHPFAHLVNDRAGHGIGRPFTSTMELNSRRHPLTGRIVRMGGTHPARIITPALALALGPPRSL